MPTYEYRCAKCGNHVEVFQSFSEAPLTKHDGCGGRLTKVLSPAGIVLKGSGFYKTDSRSGGKSQKPAASDGGGKTGTEGSSKGSESKGSESKGSESKGSESKGSGSKSTESAGSSSSRSNSSPSDAKSA
jgi:putative FmdB family regulatory protein